MNTYFVKTLFGLENVLASELNDLGASEVEILNRAVKFRGDKRLLYKSNLKLRTAIKILQQISEFSIKSADDLYKKIHRIDWENYLSVDKTFAIEAVTSSPHFTNSHYAALRVKDAIADFFREKYNKRPSVDTNDPDLKISIHIAKQNCKLSIDSSLEPLFKRGYRTARVKAPINEVLAAGLILMSAWDKKTPFLDPMCGSGTFPIEAAMIAGNIAPGILRKSYGFQKWENYDATLWNELKQEAEDEIVPIEVPIFGSDVSRMAIKAAKENTASLNLLDAITFRIRAFEKFEPPFENALLMINPPYDKRIKKKEIDDFYEMIGSRLKHFYTGSEAWIVSSNTDALKFIGLRPSKKYAVYNGGMPAKFLSYQLYKASKKASKNR